MENELAIIAIKGGRYSEAENIFNSEIQNKPTYHSYFGLGLCKLNLLLNVNRTVDEVIYCFEKSLNIAEKKDKKEVENQITVFINNVLIQYTELYLKLEDEKKNQANKALLGAALTIGAAAIGTGKNANAFTQIASLAAAGAGVGVSLDGIAKLGKIPEIQLYILDCAEKLTNKFSSLCTVEDNKSMLLISKNKLVNCIDDRKKERLKEKEEAAKIKAEKDEKEAKIRAEEERKRIEEGAKKAGITVEEFKKKEQKENQRILIGCGALLLIITILYYVFF